MAPSPTSGRHLRWELRGAPGLVLAAEMGLIALFALTLTTWFAAWPRALPTAAPFAALLVLSIIRWRLGPPRPSLPSARSGLRARLHLESAVCLGLAVVYRLAALFEPWGWVNRDGAYGAFVALHLLHGARPAPAFTEGASYQGTLKGHLAALVALVTGERDLSSLMISASLLLYLVFVASAMALARRIAGRRAALVTGLYLALSPRFLTVFSLNCVGQYVDVLALGGVALALLARLLDEDRAGAPARGEYLAVGLLLGAALWQQPVALGYAAVALLALALRGRTWSDPWVSLVFLGLVLGLLPVLLWNLQHGWATWEVVGRDPAELQAQMDALPRLAERAVLISFPIIAGLSPGHPWAELPGLRLVAILLLPLLLGGYLLAQGPRMWSSLRQGRPAPALLAPLLMLASLGLFWSVASGRVYWRPRYLLPLAAVAAVMLGVLASRCFRRLPALAVAGVLFLLVFNVVGTAPRLKESAAVAEPYRRLLRALEEKEIRTGYSDFSLSAPVTMFTSERIVLSPALGPTPAYESQAHARRVREEGPDAFVLLPDDDPERFAAVLRGLGVGFEFAPEPVPIFYGFSRRVRLEEVASFRGEEGSKAPTSDEEAPGT